ncbi:MAG: putative alpha-glycosyltransferase [Mucilaginibacter sp.]|uniref:glycosyltransferase family 4 protein n=1 Tax=Mucilaginibacter sp. TaxID=1882438 RepID=UPI00260C2A6F|nr:glycosyltransferase family 1 protein [Mucilaginibacter sp.]MDB5002310.1 putative alpha-glycosyltransferase [Mucilaginibacter sp.]
MIKREVFYDANFAIGKYRGMGKYINDLIYVISEKGINCTGLLSGKADDISKNKIAFGYSNYILWEQFSLAKYINTLNNALLFLPYNTGSIFFRNYNSKVLIIHDLIFFESYSSLSLKQVIGKYYRRLVLPRIVKKVENIITVSHFTKNEIIKKFNIDPARITVIPNSIDLGAANHIVDINKKANFFFNIGGELGHKNIKNLLKAFALFTKTYSEEYRLKIIGIRDSTTLRSYKKLALNLKIYPLVDFLGYQTDDQIAELYRNAKAFIFPSKIEGFGIPLIEAMKYGCPIVCSNTSCFPEIAKDAAAYFDPWDITNMSEVMFSVVNDINKSKHLVSNGLKVVKDYSFENFNKIVLNWYYVNYGHE